MPWVKVPCAKCGKLTEVFSRRGEPAYYVCPGCKSMLETKPKELMATIGKGLEIERRKENEALGISYRSDDDYGKP